MKRVVSKRATPEHYRTTGGGSRASSSLRARMSWALTVTQRQLKFNGYLVIAVRLQVEQLYELLILVRQLVVC